jgi:uncharacterized protein (TIGR02996 family)
MTDTEAALLRAIAAHPDEDTPRLIYADYLDELGDPSAVARAEFIRLEVRVARLPARNPEREAAIERIDQLIRAWDLTWQKEMPEGFTRLTGYRRGFPFRAAANAPALPAVADDPRLLTIDYLELTPDVFATQLREILKQPLFAQLRGLVLRGDGLLSWSGARVLAEGEFPRLERLVLARQRIGDLGLQALADSWGFPRLRELDVSYNGITAPALTAFRRSHLHARLRGFTDWGNEPATG